MQPRFSLPIAARLRPLLALIGALLLALPLQAAPQPNIIFILADDLGYGDLGCYGQQLIQTPNLDHMAAEGMRFTHFYAGAPVCAPSRAVLMTGKHVGHVSVRGNATGKNFTDLEATRPQTLNLEEMTIPEMLKKSGYATALIGKWGIGELSSGSEPTHRGFDYFYGYVNQNHAHNYYPAWLVQNESPVGLRNIVPGDGPFGQGWATKKVDYSPDLFTQQALKWVEEQKDKPFFLYLAYTIPHANDEASRALGNGQEVPSLEPYADKDWTEPNKGQAAMITRMDRDIGTLFALLKRLGLDEKTVVFFSSDNGPHHEGGNDPAFFNASGGLRGIKRDVYEGGIREPFIVRWPGQIAAGKSSGHIGYFGDVMTTIAELTGATPPPNLDSISIVPELLGRPQNKHDYLYWEFHEGLSKQAVLMEDHWKAVRLSPNAATQIFDLTADPGESNDLHDAHPEMVQRAEELFKTARTDNPYWPLRSTREKKKAEKAE